MNSLFTKLIKFFTQTFHSPKGGAGGGLVHAFSLIRADKLFSAIYIAGTAVAIASAMVVVIVLNILLADIAPEVNRSRTLYLASIYTKESDKENPLFLGFSTEAIDSCFSKMKCVEVATGIDHHKESKYVIFNKESTKACNAKAIATDHNFFRLYDLDFISGRPFSGKEFRGAEHVCVITDRIAKMFNVGKAGGYIYMSSQPFRVVGIIREVSSLLKRTSADIYLPYNLDEKVKEDGQEDYWTYAGRVDVRILLKKGYSRKDFLSELEAIWKHYNAILNSVGNEKVECEMKVMSHFFEQVNFYTSDEEFSYKIIFMLPFTLLILIFLFLPAINLSGLVTNRMEARRPEMGIRKAFGAKQRTLLKEVINENLVLTLCGGAVGWVLSCLYISLACQSNSLKLFFVDRRGICEANLDMDMFFTPTLFLVCFLCCAVLNMMAAFIPTWRSLRKPIVESLNQNR